MSFPNEEVAKKGKHYRLNADEYRRMTELLGRDPKPIEWPLFSALWNEHCSYKSSKTHLRKFAHKNPRVLESEGENAGVIDLGRGERIAFKMESHNHPSYIEPYQGAATGVGGILRDIFTMGARPIALADFLCFGQSKAERMPAIVEGVVAGISGYGNCVGVPTVTGQTEFDPAYDRNVLVNAMAVGLFRPNDPVALSKAKGPGNWVVYVGAKTGKDGVHGASMASESFDDKSDAKKPNVQIGDPFYEKLLIEACLEILRRDLVVAMQDMGAAGLTSSSFEMSSKGGVGMMMELDRVPVRDATITPEEILLSESQERMLLVCEPTKFPEIRAVFEKWDLEATKIGEVRAERKVMLKWKGEVLTEIDPDLLVENAPRYERPYNAWKPHRQKADPASFLRKTEAGSLARTLMGDVRLGSKAWIHRQYDQRVGLRTVRDANDAVAMMRLPDSGRGLAVAVGCRPSLMRMDARIGALDAIFFPSLQMAVKGARALAVTDCLNFGNPEKPEIMSEFVASVEALAEAARELDAPVISGNVSFYNETLGKNIPPTPATGLVGMRENIDKIPLDAFAESGLEVWSLRCSMVRASHRVAEILGESTGFDGDFDVKKAARFVRDCEVTVLEGAISSSRVVGAGGLFFTLRRMCAEGVGFRWTASEAASSERLFTEGLYEVVMALPAADAKTWSAKWAAQGWEPVKLGETGGDSLDLGSTGKWSLGELQAAASMAWTNTFGGLS